MVRPRVARGIRRSGGERSCINVSAFHWSSSAPGHHGYQRACDLISGQASRGQFGSPVFACAGKKNPIDRYLINSPMIPTMKKNPDGSLTLYIQKDSPGADKESNWLPAPNGPTYLIMRLYWPKTETPSILPPGEGTWQPPGVKGSSWNSEGTRLPRYSLFGPIGPAAAKMRRTADGPGTTSRSALLARADQEIERAARCLLLALS
jgi:hypothetical protein